MGSPAMVPPPPKPKGKAALGCLFTLGAFIFFLAVVAYFLGNTNSTPSASGNGSASSSSGGESAEIAVNVSAYQLWSDYQANEVAADGRYKGRALAVRGVVSGITKDFMDEVVLRLASPNEFMGIDAHLKASETQQAANLAKGDPIELLCEGNGMVIGSPQLSDCVIQPLPATRTQQLPPEQSAPVQTQPQSQTEPSEPASPDGSVN